METKQENTPAEKRVLHNLTTSKFIKIYEENGNFWLVVANFKLHEHPYKTIEACQRAAKRMPDEKTINLMFSIAKMAIEAEKHENNQK